MQNAQAQPLQPLAVSNVEIAALRLQIDTLTQANAELHRQMARHRDELEHQVSLFEQLIELPTVKTRIHRAKAQLKDQLNPSGGVHVLV